MPRKQIDIDSDLEPVDAEAVHMEVKRRAQIFYDKLAEDYDLSDLNENDRLSVMDWCTIMVRIEDLEREVSVIIAGDQSEEKWYKVERINKVLSSLRDSASQHQNNLSITRKARKGDNETSLVAVIDDYKARAKTLLSERLSYVYCPKCRELLCNAWFLFPEVDGGNSITLTCGRTTDKGKICGHRFTVTSKELKANNNRNLVDTLPV